MLIEIEQDMRQFAIRYDVKLIYLMYQSNCLAQCWHILIGEMGRQ